MRTRKTVKRGPHVLARLAATESRSQLNLFCRHPWLLAWPHATNLGLSAARPPTLRVCARAVRATCRPRAHGSLPGRPAVGSGLASHTRLQQPAGAVCFRPRAQPALRRRLAYCNVIWGRVVVTRHARPAAHTLRVVVRSATLSRLSAHVRSSVQRGRQRLAASRHQPEARTLLGPTRTCRCELGTPPEPARTPRHPALTRTY